MTPSPPYSERRRHRRYRPLPHQQVSCTVPLSDGGQTEVKVVDLSDGGLRVLVPVEHEATWPAMGASIHDITLIIDNSTTVEATAQMVWFGGTVVHGSKFLHAGLAFVSMSDATAARLHNALKRMMPEEHDMAPKPDSE